MEFTPDDIKLVPVVLDTIERLINIYKERRDSRQPGEHQDNEGMDSCFKKAVFMLQKESEIKKLSYIESFVQNTILSESCDLDTGTILHLLNDIEGMTWRQLCFIEGLRKMRSKDIEIKGVGDSSNINSISKTIEMERLTVLGYLYTRTEHLFDYNTTLEVNKIYIPDIGSQLAELMNLKSISLEEIAQAFGSGQIKATITY